MDLHLIQIVLFKYDNAFLFQSMQSALLAAALPSFQAAAGIRPAFQLFAPSSMTQSLSSQSVRQATPIVSSPMTFSTSAAALSALFLQRFPGHPFIMPTFVTPQQGPLPMPTVENSGEK